MRAAATLFAAALLLAGCAGSSDDESAPTAQPPTAQPPTATSSATSEPAPTAAAPTEAEATGPVVDIVIKDGRVTPQGDRVEVTAGDEVTLNITSDADEEIHVHSEPEHSVEVTPGDTVSESFRLDTPGQVAVEAHHLDVTIVQLVVRP